MLVSTLFCCNPSRSTRPASSLSTFPLRSKFCSAALLLTIMPSCCAESWSSALQERFKCVSVPFSATPSSSILPPSSPSRLRRRLSVSSDEFDLSARPKYLPPSACTWLSDRLSEISTHLSVSSLAIAFTPRSAILLCERSSDVMVLFACSPVARTRVVLSSSRLHGRERMVSVSVTRSAFCSDVTSFIFIPKSERSYSMPISLTPNVISRLHRVGIFWNSISISRCDRNCFIRREKT
mmetsp:Transcript_2784/g.7779  ORF Transcript_2784/g.7779 Transcript_2784/m.7779 type:complete len:238 (-) Transcript_2784:467-1180(-)